MGTLEVTPQVIFQEGMQSVPIESLNELETKIETLIDAFKSLKEESGKLREELDSRKQSTNELETKNQSLSGELGVLKGSLDERQKKLDVAAGKIQEILRKLESVG